MLAVRPPGDKSISHRALILATLAEGESRIRGLLAAADVRATARALRRLGAEVPEELPADLEIPGPAAWRDAPDTVDCGNSGTTARLLLGLIAGAGVAATLDGDPSLRSRPMGRVVYPLQAMGARLRYRGQPERLPVQAEARASGSLRPLRHRPRVASAQVKSSLLLAGLVGRVRVEVDEPGRSRDHTERLLGVMGAPIRVEPGERGPRVELDPSAWGGPLAPLDMDIPGDPSSAAFLVGAAILAGRPLRVERVSLNPTRLGFLDVLRRMGVALRAEATGDAAGEPLGNLVVEPAALQPFEIGPEEIPGLVDEVPILCVLAARAAGISRLHGAGELRVKESDRLAGVARNLQELGVRCRETPDGLEIEGTTARLSGRVRAAGDHRLAMAFGVLKAEPNSGVEVDDPGCVSVSFPEYWTELERVMWWPAA